MANHSGIIDNGTAFEIVPNTRKITVPPMYKVIGTVGDHLSEQLTFRCPKLVDGHDVAGCARHYITWKNANQEVGHDELNIANSDDEYIYFKWLVRDGLTAAKGLVSFSIHFEDLDANGLTIYRWSTTACTECEILDSINAVLGAYEAIYVVGDTLVIADYVPVKDGTLTLETNGLIPEGTMEINDNGTYDVGKYAQVEVSVNLADDPDFVAKNIKKGVDIKGVIGSYDPLPLVSGCIRDNTITNNIDVGIVVYYSGYSATLGESYGVLRNNWYAFNNRAQLITKFVKDLPIIIMPSLGASYPMVGEQQAGQTIELLGDVELVASACDGSLFVVRPTGDNFEVRVPKTPAIG